jgi:hypothetical protein
MLSASTANESGELADWSVSLVMRRSGVRFPEAAPLSPVIIGLWPTTSSDVIGCRLLTELLTVKRRSEMTEDIYQYTDASGVRTIVEDARLAEALRTELPGGSPVIWRTLEDEWNFDMTVRRIIKAEIPRATAGQPLTGEIRGRSISESEGERPLDAPEEEDVKNMTLTEFLLARIAEDERHARAVKRPLFGQTHPVTVRALAECESKRQIVELHVATERAVATIAPLDDVIGDAISQSALAVTTGVLQLLALPYAAHPDYQESWRP